MPLKAPAEALTRPRMGQGIDRRGRGGRHEHPFLACLLPGALVGNVKKWRRSY